MRRSAMIGGAAFALALCGGCASVDDVFDGPSGARRVAEHERALAEIREEIETEERRRAEIVTTRDEISRHNREIAEMLSALEADAVRLREQFDRETAEAEANAQSGGGVLAQNGATAPDAEAVLAERRAREARIAALEAEIRRLKALLRQAVPTGSN